MLIHNTAGDAVTFVRIMQTLSTYYQGLPPPMMPTFDKYTQADPILDPDTVPAILPYLSQLAVDYESEEVAKSHMTSASNACRVDVTLTAEEVTAITLSARQDTKSQISSMDALAGYFATIINRIAEEPIDQLVHVVEASSCSLLMAFW